MTNDHDRSDKDDKYFIDNSVYNCPFCKRRSVTYNVNMIGSYDASNEKKVYYYTVICHECEKTSLHLSEYHLKTYTYNQYKPNALRFVWPLKAMSYEIISEQPYREAHVEKDMQEIDCLNELDTTIFYSCPTSFFAIDARIPASIRKPLMEAENSLQSNFLTGASGCLRKAIYKLLKEKDIPDTDANNKFYSHEQRMEILKGEHPHLDPSLFDELKGVQQLTSQELHDNDWVDFSSSHLRFLLHVTKEILMAIYVKPDEEKKRREKISELKKKSKPKKI